MVVQQELDHLLVARARAVKQGRPASAVLALQLSALLQEGKKTGSETKQQIHFSTSAKLNLYLKQEVRNALIATAGCQHQGGQPFGCGRVDVHTGLQQEVDNVVVADVRGVHQRGPTSDVLAVQIHLTPAAERKWWRRSEESLSLHCVRCASFLHRREWKRRHLLFDALGHHIVLANGAGGVQVQRDVQLLGPHQGVAEPHGQAGTQLLRLTGFVAQLGHFRTLHRQGVNVTLQLKERCVR